METTKAINKNYLIKWNRWVELLHEDVQKLLVNREIYKRYLEIVKNNTEIQSPSDFHVWARENYVASVALAIRRQLDTRRDVISTIRLLTDIKNNNQVLSKSWYKNTHNYDWADPDSVGITGNNNCIDKKIVEKDIKDLEALGEDIKTYTHTYIAHKSKNEMTKLPTFNDVDKFVDKLEEIMKKYILLFTTSGYASLLPTWQYDWEEIFTKKWIKDSE